MPLARVIDPWWLAVTGVSAASLLLVSGWPDRSGLVSDGLIVATLVSLAVAVLVYATRHAEGRLMWNELRAVERRQALTIELARLALTCEDLPRVMREATRLVAGSLGVEFCAVLECVAEDDTLVLRAGLGWPESSVGRPVTAPVNASRALATSSPSQPAAPWQPGHSVQSGISMGLEAHHHTYGVLDVYTTSQRVFTREELQFVRIVADLLGAAIEHARMDPPGPRARQAVSSMYPT
jgi:hypothetical protein